MKDSRDAFWYKDAIVYEIDIRAFYDSNYDGFGDIRGLIEKLDYCQCLGVSVLYLLPFYSADFNTEGVIDFKTVDPIYGTLHDFKDFLHEAHRREIRVILTLLLSHTSDRHPWFQRASTSGVGSSARDWYIWSDSPHKTRVANHGEASGVSRLSNQFSWSWDPNAVAYYRHGLNTSQPCLNYENPRVQDAMRDVVDFWLSLGVDGFVLSGVANLLEESHDEGSHAIQVFLKELRKHIDTEFEHRVLIAEAKLPSKGAARYLRNGDECHMSVHFALAAALFISIYSEDNDPFVKVIAESFPISSISQWALILRNHDELSLEMIPLKDRERLLHELAAEPRFRISHGIRRRLAPLMNNDLGRLKLLFSLVFSLPGTPVIYYGDEIGMGDNVYLGGCDGLRTPMHWSSDRGAGFSRANFEKLYLPLIMDRAYGYPTVNVEDQLSYPSSLFNWIRGIIQFRRRFKAFSQGTFCLLKQSNHTVIAFLRRYEDDTILCIANLSYYPQPLELDLSTYQGMTPIELMGGKEFPAIEDRPYSVVLSSHSYYWFKLTGRVIPPAFYSCFVSYSHADKAFAHRLHEALHRRGIRCWLDEHEMLPGDDMYEEVARGINLWDKILLCCSKDSLTSWWVDNEINVSFEKEQRLMKQRGRKALAIIPLNLDGFLLSGQWKSGKASQIRSRLAADFRGWQHDDRKFEEMLEQVVRALRVDDGRAAPPQPKL